MKGRFIMAQYDNQPTRIPAQVRHAESMCRGNGVNLGAPEVQGQQTQPLGGMPNPPIHITGAQTITNVNVGHDGGKGKA